MLSIVKLILSISLDTFSTQNAKQVRNHLSEMEQISMELSGMDKIFANILTLKAQNDKLSLEFIKQYFCDIYDYFEVILGG